MNKILLGFALLGLLGCSTQKTSSSDGALEGKIAHLQKQVDDLKPGLGEIMGVIQQHHAKLYYAGTKANWPLAQYELDEIQEGLDAAVKYYPRFEGVSTPLTELVPTMTKGGVAQVRSAIEAKNSGAFTKAFEALSTSCSSCHQAANHPFVKIQNPGPGMYSDQKFEP